MNSIGLNLRRIREQKGLSQEYLADRLDISQASYARLENEDTKITVDRLLKIAEILETEVTDFFNTANLSIQTQNNHDNSYGYIQNLTIDNKDITEKLIKSFEARLKEKDEQISFLKNILSRNNFL
ncbi:helix-turn-helix domain-containing protein [Capnocytophaga catalasegens]|uniref:HTH cro/C1-type domain-containing protein n=1 Tax=Capnocytophaga catalasegens TaxID=1004260 RepID=A0AAV5AQP2_9FLAO|nr:helix-turn-helix domain-containing protein [Capnocytophaga catalasegens]GIZ14259.1 hypothetical protein RCZ03_02600 [Capnocytophaga catalasegens]GJM49602.1 hypothetical protein RCZ15_05770 [Capnocytophaga catalasegens]GJM52915.1 hypothetical protein RCZ16_12320 [Capnocytophaga catalasegens]